MLPRSSAIAMESPWPHLHIGSIKSNNSTFSWGILRFTWVQPWLSVGIKTWILPYEFLSTSVHDNKSALQSHGGANESPVNYICTLSSCCIYSLSHNWDQLGIHQWCLTMMRAIYLPPSQVHCNIEDAAKSINGSHTCAEKIMATASQRALSAQSLTYNVLFWLHSIRCHVNRPSKHPKDVFFICTSTLLTLCTAFLSKFMRALIGGAECRAMLQCPERCLDCPN